MFFFQDHRSGGNLGIQNSQDRRRIPESKGRQSEDFGDSRAGGQLFQIHYRINSQARMKIRWSETLAGVGLKALPKLRDHFRRHAYARCLPMAAEAGEEIRHRFERFQQMERSNRSEE